MVGLSGYAGAGKDAVAAVLVERYGYRRLAFADKIKAVAYDLNPLYRDAAAGRCLSLRETVDALGWDGAKAQPEVRRMLQDLGASARKHLGLTVWVDAVAREIESSEAPCVVSDVRYWNEVLALRGFDAQFWMVERPGVTAANDHPSEHAWRRFVFDRVVANDGRLEDLAAKVADALEER